MDTEENFINLDSTLLIQKGMKLEAACKPSLNKISSESLWEDD